MLLEGEPKRMFRDGEFRLYCIIVLASTVLVAMNLFSNGLMGAGDALHHATFQVVSFMSTTGFVSTDYGSWPLFSQCVLYVLCYIGGCAGSTGGGMKVVRIGAMVQAFRAAITRRIHPTAMVRVHHPGHSGLRRLLLRQRASWDAGAIAHGSGLRHRALRIANGPG